MTYAELIAFINFWIKTNGNNEITAAVLNPVLQAITDWTSSNIGELDNLNTTDRTNLVAAINEVNTNLANIEDNGSQVYFGTDDPNDTPPPFFNTGDFYDQLDLFNESVALFLYDGSIWQNLSQTFQDTAPIAYLTLKLIGKGVGNTDPSMRYTLEEGDSVQGRADSTTVWTEAIYNGGDPNDRGNYTPLVQTLL